MKLKVFSDQTGALAGVMFKKLAHPFAVFVSFALFYVVFFSPVLLSGRVLVFGDAIIFHFPIYYSRNIAWDPLIFSGFPMAAEPQSMWYPISLAISWIPGSWNAFVISSYILASCFTYAYVYALTRSRLAGVVGGMVYGMSGPMIGMMTHTTNVHAALWVPLLFLALEKLRDNFSAWYFSMACLAVACAFLAGHPQVFFYGMGLSAAYAAVLGYSSKERWRYYACYLLIIVLGIGLSAIQLIPTVELARQGAHWKLSFEEFAAHSFPVRQSLQIIFPYLFGGHSSFYGVEYFGQGAPAGTAVYAGLLPLMLAYIGLKKNSRKTVAWFWLAVIVISFSLILGDALPLARLIYHVPVFNKFRSHVRYSFGMTLAIGVLSGLGVTAVEQQRASAKLVLKVIFYGMAIISICLVIIFISPGYLEEMVVKAGLDAKKIISWHNPAIYVPVMIFVLAGVVFLYWARDPGSKFRQILLILFLAVDLGSAGWFFSWQDLSPEKAKLEPPPYAERYRKLLGASNQRMLPISGGEPLCNGNPSEIPPNISRLWGVPSAAGGDPLFLSRYSEFLKLSLYGGVQGKWDNKAVDVLAVRYAFISSSSINTYNTFATTFDKSRWHHVEDITGENFYTNRRIITSVYENMAAMPRAWLVPEVMRAGPEEVLRSIQTAQMPDGRVYDPYKVAFVEEPLAFKAENPDLSSSAGILELSDTEIKIKTTSKSPSFLVLSDVYYPGWKASVDGTNARIYQTDYILRGVLIPPGGHEVRFYFRPFSVYSGAMLTAASLAVLLVFLFIKRKNPVRMDNP